MAWAVDSDRRRKEEAATGMAGLHFHASCQGSQESKAAADFDSGASSNDHPGR